MKTTYKLIIAALAAAAALSSCTKDIAADREDVTPQDGVRTIAVSFTPQTKTRLEDGLQPWFDNGDVIKVSNGSECKDITIQVDPQTNNAFFTTTLTGALKAVYPATAAKLNGNAIEGVKVPVFQTGKFKDANICMANIAADEKEATFYNKTAILRFYVDRSVDVRVITIICKDGYITTESIEGLTVGTARDRKLIYILSEVPEDIKDLPKDPNEMAPLSTTTDDPNKRLCYAAILPISNADICFIGMAPTQDATEGSSKRVNYNVTLNEGDIANAFIPYYIKVKVGGTNDAPEYQNWSYCNLGAFLPEEAGYYYSWGNSIGHWKNGISDRYSFSSDNYNTTSGCSLTNDIQANSESDAVFNAWVKGQDDLDEVYLKWRMPTKAEFEKLISATNTTGANFTEGKGLSISGSPLLFPCTGYFNEAGNALQYKDELSFLWTSSINDSEYAYGLRAAQSGVVVQPFFRYTGIPIRPIYDPDLSENEQLTLTITAYPDNGTF